MKEGEVYVIWQEQIVEYPVLFASGNGASMLRTVVVFTQGNYGSLTARQAFDV